MNEFLVGLAEARRLVDVNVAAGTAIPKMQKLYYGVVTVLVLYTVAMTFGYLELRGDVKANNRQESTLVSYERQAQTLRLQMKREMDLLAKERAAR